MSERCGPYALATTGRSPRHDRKKKWKQKGVWPHHGEESGGTMCHEARPPMQGETGTRKGSEDKRKEVKNHPAATKAFPERTNS